MSRQHTDAELAQLCNDEAERHEGDWSVTIYNVALATGEHPLRVQDAWAAACDAEEEARAHG